eukprot:2553349-Prymnesium_polylepis.1
MDARSSSGLPAVVPLYAQLSPAGTCSASTSCVSPGGSADAQNSSGPHRPPAARVVERTQEGWVRGIATVHDHLIRGIIGWLARDPHAVRVENGAREKVGAGSVCRGETRVGSCDDRLQKASASSF